MPPVYPSRASCEAARNKRAADAPAGGSPSKWSTRRTLRCRYCSRSPAELLALQILEHAVEALIRRVAAGLRGLSGLKRLIGRALSARSRLPGFVRRALSCVGGVPSSFGNASNLFELLGGHGAAGSDRGTDDQRRRAQYAGQVHRH